MKPDDRVPDSVDPDQIGFSFGPPEGFEATETPGVYAMDVDVLDDGSFRPRARPTVPDSRFDGDDYDDARDRPRLGRQLQAVYDIMKDGEPHTIEEVATRTGFPQQSVARQIRYLRAPRFGGHTVEREYVGDGLYTYRMVT